MRNSDRPVYVNLTQ